MFSCKGAYCESKIVQCPIKDCDARKCDSACKQTGCEYSCPDEDPYKNCETPACKHSINATCRTECNNPGCLFDSGNCIAPVKKCEYEDLCQKLYKDDSCNSFCNTRECGYDVDCFQEPHLVKQFSLVNAF